MGGTQSLSWLHNLRKGKGVRYAVFYCTSPLQLILDTFHSLSYFVLKALHIYIFDIIRIVLLRVSHSRIRPIHIPILIVKSNPNWGFLRNFSQLLDIYNFQYHLILILIPLHILCPISKSFWSHNYWNNKY